MLSVKIQRFAALLLTFCAFSINADVFKSIDATGRVTYSDRPQHEQSEKLNLVSRPTDNKRIAQMRQDALDAKHAEAAQLQQQAEINKQNEENRAVYTENCLRATNAFSSLANVTRLYVPDEKGERRYLNEQEIATRRDNAQKDVEKWCVDK